MSFESDIKKQWVAIRYGDLAVLQAASLATLSSFGSEATSQILHACAEASKELNEAKKKFKDGYKKEE